ncbi:uncharacterized protein LOC117177437 [Belonocnema kinseyi]|uniref:uncharacterized protein LOC117177437 n=1 Tax=Belonocnema kinseyi TaxID=2817044 RepID=UPI00143CE9C9|nr:uncharacterized protein LOC117177437 [Belonocnema kinseyi]
MPTTLCMETKRKYDIGKLTTPYRVETLGLARDSKRLHIRDRNSGLVFLIDTGSDISLLPADQQTLKTKPSELELFAANDSRVHTYDSKRISLNLGLRRDLTWNFCVAAVPYPIIGADLLAHFSLVPYLHESKLVDTKTGLSTRGFLKATPIFGVSLIDRSTPFGAILRDFPKLTLASQETNATYNDKVMHHIITTVPPVADRARRLHPDKLTAAKATFKDLVKDGICRPSSSPWASPIHLVRKKNQE